MRIIISPAKNMRDYQSLNMKIDTPIFIDKAKNILSKLKTLSKSELTTLWKCNSKMVNALYEVLHSTNLNQDLIPAIFRYDGLVYKNINPSTFNNSFLYSTSVVDVYEYIFPPSTLYFMYASPLSLV